MCIYYSCRHCHTEFGKIDREYYQVIHLALSQLSEEDKREMLMYHVDGNIYVKVICEHCQSTLEENPHYHECHTFLQ
ncbi:anti-sigma-F factor Fin [Priestia taiwanensis]|uniref:Anti-sigma-F factor Fin n=1 Tax=Priestia taiwanensis TaxID=1347902 RepID=A0A917EU76_9BACI|nr:anti-sigma-F factor Fin [Priestia taiwanensis]MBM7365178.1 hypothetical protein [Priestia taiwanensis]GGE84659.1 anti-sigma-F factor Fin [Priestia taiwanensis]